MRFGRDEGMLLRDCGRRAMPSIDSKDCLTGLTACMLVRFHHNAPGDQETIPVGGDSVEKEVYV